MCLICDEMYVVFLMTQHASCALALLQFFSTTPTHSVSIKCNHNFTWIPWTCQPINMYIRSFVIRGECIRITCRNKLPAELVKVIHLYAYFVQQTAFIIKTSLTRFITRAIQHYCPRHLWIALLKQSVTSIVSAFLTYLWAGVYTYYRQLEETNIDVVPQNTSQILTYEKPPGEETIINPEEIRNTYTQIEHNIQQCHPQAV
jgi:hypothetical protein